jgi:hypothetical protein
MAMWLAIKTRLGLDDSSVTAEMKTNFRCSAQGLNGRVRQRRWQAADASYGYVYLRRTGSLADR